jgi:hypothetical protein
VQLLAIVIAIKHLERFARDPNFTHPILRDSCRSSLPRCATTNRNCSSLYNPSVKSRTSTSKELPFKILGEEKKGVSGSIHGVACLLPKTNSAEFGEVRRNSISVELPPLASYGF